jgi:acyl-CoA thioesterase FadM
MKVYIEDTDAYGVMYNANYLRSYERALLLSAAIVHDDSDDDNDDWSVIHLKQQKFKSSPALGGDYVIKGVQQQQQQRHDESGHLNSWDLVMQCPHTDIIYNTATLTVGLTGWKDETNSTNDCNCNSVGGNGTFTHNDTLHRDEFDPHRANHLPLRSVLNLCERARSNYIGGPGALRKLQEDQDILVVVTNVKDCFSVQHHFYPRQSVQVVTEIIPKRLACDCRHVLLDEEGNVIAKAVVTLMSLNAKTKRPTYKEGLWSATFQ